MPGYIDTIENLLTDINTKEALGDFTGSIHEALSYVYRGGNKLLSEKILGKVSEPFRQKIIDLEAAGSLPALRREQSDFLKTLLEYCESLPSLKLTMAFIPSQEFVNKLAGWVRGELGKKVILDTALQETIIGGCIFEYGGEHRDWSLEAKLDETLDQEIKKLI